MDVDGRNVRRLTPWKLDADTPDLSLATRGPTKDLIALETYGMGAPRGKSSNVATVPATCNPVSECRKRTRFVTHHHSGAVWSFNPSWSPSGRRLAYVRFKPGDRHTPAVGDIWTARPDGSQRRPVSRSPLFEYRPDWGPAPSG
jgi:WD40-like Beta Propeller Repeat